MASNTHRRRGGAGLQVQRKAQRGERKQASVKGACRKVHGKGSRTTSRKAIQQQIFTEGINNKAAAASRSAWQKAGRAPEMCQRSKAPGPSPRAAGLSTVASQHPHIHQMLPTFRALEAQAQTHGRRWAAGTLQGGAAASGPCTA